MASFNPNNPSGGSGGGGGLFGGGNAGGMGARPKFRFGPGRWGPAVKTLILANVAIYILQSFANLIPLFALTPGDFYTKFPLWQPLTYMFLHGGFGHIFFNMLMLWMFGVEIEERLGLRSFLRLYFFSGFGGALAALIFDYGSMSPIVGASGAIFGVLVAYWRFFPERTILLYFVIPVKIKYMIPVMVGLGLYATMTSAGGNIAHLAHLGGAAVGFIMTRAGARGGDPGVARTAGGPGFFERRRNRKKEKTRENLTAKFENNRQQAEDTMRRVDAILDKINDVGIENISQEDRKFLEDASNKLSGDKTQGR